MQCLKPLFAPPSVEPLDGLISYYENLLGTVAGKQRDFVSDSLAAFRKKKKIFFIVYELRPFLNVDGLSHLSRAFFQNGLQLFLQSGQIVRRHVRRSAHRRFRCSVDGRNAHHVNFT
jgi:hypothetical protein